MSDSGRIFPDVSEADRAVGRVAAGKVRAWLQGGCFDTYLGGNTIAAKPPEAAAAWDGLDDNERALLEAARAGRRIERQHTGMLGWHPITTLDAFAALERGEHHWLRVAP